MTGIFVRVQRGGVWEIAEFDQLTDAELEDFVTRTRAIASASTPEEAALDCWGWALALARWIRDHVREQPEGGPWG